MLKTIKTALLLSGSMTFLIAAQPTYAEGSLVWFGEDLTQDSNYTYLGGVHAFNDDLNSSGALVRLNFGIGSYEYKSGTSKVDGDNYSSSISVGYQHFFTPDTRLTGYLGVAYEDHDLSPSNTINDVSGSDVGGKIGADFLTKVANNVSIGILGNYTNAFNTYWSRARVGYDLGSLTVGPEITALGNESFDEQRYGLSFSGIKITQAIGIDASIGYSDSSRTGDDSVYANLALHTSW